MPVESFVDNPQPADPTAVVRRYVEFWKLQDLVQTGELYFRRGDRLDDEHEGLPPTEYERVLNLNRFDIKDVRQRDNDIGHLAQSRQSFYVNCWHLETEETATMWARYGKDGVAIVSRYDLLKKSLEPIRDRVMLGPIRYGTAHLQGWNVIRFMTTKRAEFSREREVRVMIWMIESGDGMNRHIDKDNNPRERPIYDPPSTLPDGIRRAIDVTALITQIVISPLAPPTRLDEVEGLLRSAGIDIAVLESPLTRFSSLIPTDEELKRHLPER